MEALRKPTNEGVAARELNPAFTHHADGVGGGRRFERLRLVECHLPPPPPPLSFPERLQSLPAKGPHSRRLPRAEVDPVGIDAVVAAAAAAGCHRGPAAADNPRPALVSLIVGCRTRKSKITTWMLYGTIDM